MGERHSDKVEDLRAMLQSASHGGFELDALKQLLELANAGDFHGRDAIFEHASGQRGVHRAHAASLLAELSGALRRNSTLAPLRDVRWADLFKRLLENPVTRYWAIPGYLHARGPAGYAELVEMASDSRFGLNNRAYAIKCLAQASGQTLDRELPSDPGHWKETDLRLTELAKWQADGFPKGAGYAPPARDPALDNPKTELERLAARLDARLAISRTEQFDLEDPARPSLRLVPAAKHDLDSIAALWALPANYLEFLTRFSPLRVSIDSETYYNGGLALYGAADLIERQCGYAWNPDPAHPLEGWPKGHLVIADHGCDPVVLDLSKTSGNDAPVLTAEHGAGRWDFELLAPSFEAFIAGLLEEK